MNPQIIYSNESIIEQNNIDNVRYILNPCANNKKWNEELSYFIPKKWDEPKMLFEIDTLYNMGDTQCVHVDDKIIIANIIVFIDKKEGLVFSEGAFRYALNKINSKARIDNGTIHILRKNKTIGDMNWMTIHNIISQVMSVNIYIHDIP